MADLVHYISSEGSVHFREAKQLTDIESKNDPETEPYKSLYEARQIWAKLKCELEKYEHEPGYDEPMAVLLYYIGVNFFDSDEVGSGEENIRKCIELLDAEKISETTCNILQNAYNYMAIVWTSRQQPNKALEFVKRAEKLYEEYTNTKDSPPLCLNEFLNPVDNCSETETEKRRKAFEEAYTKTTYYLAQVYTRLEDNDAAAHYCHFTLKRQLLEGSFEPLEWALNSATLSQYYIGRNISAARHCLASASVIIQQVSKPDLAQSDNLCEDEKILRAFADLERCWGKYALNLLDESKEKLFEAMEQEKAVTVDEEKPVDRFDLDTEKLEEEVPDKFQLTFKDARPVFLFGQRKFNEALKFYTLDDFCTDHVEIQQDMSKLFKGLSFFEEDMDRQCKMEKRRIDILSPLLNDKLNQQVYLMVCRQLMYEIAEIYSNMVDLKLALMEQNSATIHTARKLNSLVRESVKYYDKYTHSFNNPDGNIPKELEDCDLRPMLTAYFCTGRLFSKIVPANKEERIRYLDESVARYKTVVDYCETRSKAAEVMESELDLCKELIVLLPVKAEKIRTGDM